MSDKQEVTMQGIVETAKWDGDSIVYKVRVMRPDHKDENIVGHVIKLVKPPRDEE